jgi:ABC-2 type transport system ATP-binding protein
MESIVSIRKVSKQYANHLALDHVNMEIPEQCIFGLLGPNGAGKTSLIRIITQITGADTGEILFKGELLSPKHIGRIGYLPEERGLYKKMEVGEQLIYMGQLKGLSRREVMEKCKYWVEKFEIKDWWKKKLEELSKGMQQKVQFITTILHDPELVILDEPFTGFDPINANLIKDEILELKKKGATIIFSTHRMESVEQLCDHIALINKSKKVLEGPVREIRNSFRTDEYEVEYFGTLGYLPQVELISDEVIHEDHRMAVLKSKELNANQLIQLITPQVQLEMFRHRIPSINDIFIQVVERAD